MEAIEHSGIQWNSHCTGSSSLSPYFYMLCDFKQVPVGFQGSGFPYIST